MQGIVILPNGETESRDLEEFIMEHFAALPTEEEKVAFNADLRRETERLTSLLSDRVVSRPSLARKFFLRIYRVFNL